MPAVLAIAGVLTLGALNPAQAVEMAQVLERAESASPESASPESTSPESTSPESTSPASELAEDRPSSEATTVPLTLTRSNEDPLLPGKVNGRPLTAPEQERLRLGLKRLNLEANASYAQGDRPAAYRKAFRILALSQYLPAPEELSSLTRIGRRAWQDSLAEESQVITARIRQLEADAGEKLSISQRRSFAEAYESLGAWEPAIAHYQTLLAKEQPNGEKEVTSNRDASGAVVSVSPEPPASPSTDLTEATLVNRLARLSLLSLDYSGAALYTEQALLLSQEAEASPSAAVSSNSSLLAPDVLAPDLSPLTQSAPDLSTPGLSVSNALETDLEAAALPLPSESAPAQTTPELLTQLAYIYEQDQRFAEAAAVQQQIFPLYSDPLFVSQQPGIKLAIARNQTRSGQLVEAIASYQAAYGQAQTLQQFDVSNDALSQLAELYRNQNQPDDALAVYDVLLQVNELSYNLYGIADTQASRAEILVEQQQFDPARRAYRQAIYAAKLLGYREAELQQRLDALTQP